MRSGGGAANPAFALEDVSLNLGGFALRHINLSLQPGEIGVLLGPNGAGKSITLETVAGFHRPDAGRVIISGRNVTDLPPERRRVAFILQNFGLFPHLTVAENIAFGLHARGRAQARADVDVLLARFHLEKVARARPATLSPGEKQRTALARGLLTQPDVFLLDEPFAALDTRTSDSLREELRRFIREAHIPALFVTHDHVDALALSDKVIVMSRGEIIQTGAATDVFHRPKTRFVAEFLGTENVLSGTVRTAHATGYAIEAGGRQFEVPAGDERRQVGEAVLLCIRADAVDVARSDYGLPVPAGRTVRLTGKIVAIANAGRLVRVTLDCGFFLTAHLLWRTAQERQLQLHQEAVADVDAAAIHLIRDE